VLETAPTTGAYASGVSDLNDQQATLALYHGTDELSGRGILKVGFLPVDVRSTLGELAETYGVDLQELLANPYVMHYARRSSPRTLCTYFSADKELAARYARRANEVRYHALLQIFQLVDPVVHGGVDIHPRKGAHVWAQHEIALRGRVGVVRVDVPWKEIPERHRERIRSFPIELIPEEMTAAEIVIDNLGWDRPIPLHWIRGFEIVDSCRCWEQGYQCDPCSVAHRRRQLGIAHPPFLEATSPSGTTRPGEPPVRGP
jgi:hypothetical protein